MAAQFTRLYMDGADRTVLELSGVGYHTVPLEIGDWNTIHVAWRWSWNDNGFLPGEGPSPGLQRPTVFVGVCAKDKPPTTANAFAVGHNVVQTFTFAWNSYPVSPPESEPLGKTSFYCAIQGTYYSSGIPTRAEVGNLNFFPRYGETTNSDAFFFYLSKNNPAVAPNWITQRLYTAEYAFMDDGSPSGGRLRPEEFRASLHSHNLNIVRNIWNDAAGTVLRPLPKNFSLGSSGFVGGFPALDEGLEGKLDHLCLYWDMVGSVHGVFIYDMHVIRIN